MPQRFTPARLERLIDLLRGVRDQSLTLESSLGEELAAVRPEHQSSARNLIHFLGLREHDLRDLQRELSALGLSALEHSEAHALASIDAALAALHRLAERPMQRSSQEIPPVDFFTGPERLALRADELLGPASAERPTRIIVTMPGEAAHDYALVRDLMRAGMTVMRINGAHDDRVAWEQMTENLRRARVELGVPCRVLFDLAGPKLRTGEVTTGPGIVRFSPQRDARGDVLSPALLWLTPRDLPESAREEMVVLPLELGFLQKVRAGDALEVADRRGGVRRVQIVAQVGRSFRAEARRTGYVEEGARVRLWRDGRLVAQAAVDALPPIEQVVMVRAGETLVLTREDVRGAPALRTTGGAVVVPAHIPCTLPEVFTQVRRGQRVFLDDGKTAGEIERADDDRIEIRITRARPLGARLRPDLGINLPDTDLSLAPLTDKDLRDLAFAARQADLVGLSFVRRPDDVARLGQELAARQAAHVGILLKIETAAGFENLPRLLLAGLRVRSIGVMVARGDLGVELGFERLAEVQDEILSMAEAAHVPVVWATQVLESLAKKGRPSRAEVTDAATSARAEAVLLNKGPHIVEAVSFLDNVLRRTRRQQEKKRSRLRRVALSEVR